jgi:hypothetical protein
MLTFWGQKIILGHVTNLIGKAGRNMVPQENLEFLGSVEKHFSHLSISEVA